MVQATVLGGPLPFDSAMYAAGGVTLKGTNCVTGDPPDVAAVTHGGTYSATPGNTIIGAIETGPSSLPRLDYEILRDIAEDQIKPNGQNNLYTADDIAAGKIYPTTFWYTRGDDGVDNDGDGDVDEEDEWVPNIVYIETNLVLKGDIGTASGFFVVVGDVLTNPSAEADTTINGNGLVDGCIYTLGEFRVNGGGAADLNVNGGVWAEDIRLNGGVNVSYNEAYMDAIELLNIDTKPYISHWRENAAM